MLCQPGTMAMVKSKLTTVCTESTSGVARPGQQQVGGLVHAPVPRRAAPAQRQHAVDHAARSGSRRGRAAWPGRASGPRTRTAATPWRRSKPRTRPTPAGCGTAAARPWCSDRGTASRTATAGPCGAAGTCRRRPRRTASWPRRSG